MGPQGLQGEQPRSRDGPGGTERATYAHLVPGPASISKAGPSRVPSHPAPSEAKANWTPGAGPPSEAPLVDGLAPLEGLDELVPDAVQAGCVSAHGIRRP